MGAHHRDPQSIDVPLAGPAVPKRVALVPEPFGGETDAAIAEGVRIAGRALEAAVTRSKRSNRPWSSRVTSLGPN